ncbi:hypothetical protein [Deefgea sp. CFH1-16]|uniref:hypothetical protein n=1 Tax=Deefgea sp. CFH1-16 TaxID=2675457 RepID=UPI0015F5B15A|nr:hypothetical protein [Deefgea sp. CFH1-16]MBM5575853.1 hypothetical protein [Deefgea sp. CFH1-16]
MSAMPLIRLEVEGMKHTICVALQQHLLQMDEQIKASVDAICQPDHIAKIIEETASREIKTAIESEVRNFYNYGKGREAIKEAVNKALDDR